MGQQTAEAGSRLDRPGSLDAERLGPRQEPLSLASVGGDGESGDGMSSPSIATAVWGPLCGSIPMVMDMARRRNPPLNVRRHEVDYESRRLGLGRKELGAFAIQAGLGSPRNHALAGLEVFRGHQAREQFDSLSAHPN